MKIKKNKTKNELERFHYNGFELLELDIDKAQSAYYISLEALLMEKALRRIQRIDYNEYRGTWKEIKVKVK